MVTRLLALLLALALTAGCSLAEPQWKEDTQAQQVLKAYIGNVNEFLALNGEQRVNSVFEQYRDLAEMGITAEDDAEVPEGVTVTVYLYERSIHYLLLRVNDLSRFPRIAGAFLQALSPQTATQEESLRVPAERAAAAMRNPKDSFEDAVEEEKLCGTSPRLFYAYYPNQYHDGTDWMQMMIIFPLEGYWHEEDGVINADTATAVPYRDEDQDEEYEGYFSEDEYLHLEIFTTPTPEPDSAAAEYDDW